MVNLALANLRPSKLPISRKLIITLEFVEPLMLSSKVAQDSKVWVKNRQEEILLSNFFAIRSLVLADLVRVPQNAKHFISALHNETFLNDHILFAYLCVNYNYQMTAGLFFR